MSKGGRQDPAAPAGGTSLADLLKAKGLGVATPGEAPAPPPAPVAPGVDLTTCGKLVLRRERKGRGGKTATVVEGLNLRPKAMDALLRTLRKTLGCGGSLEGDRLVLHGDLSERAATWLQTHGAKKVILGN